MVNVLLAKGGEEVKKDLEMLISGENISKIINENIVMGDIEKSSDNLWSFLLFTGYLKAKEDFRKEEDIFYTLSIPNREVRSLYKNIIEHWFKDTITKQNYDTMLKSLVSGDIKVFGKLLKQFVLKSISYFDVGGYGPYDVMIIPKDTSKLGIIIEFKKLDIDDEETLEETADEVLGQIEDKKYATTLEDRGIENILKLGIVFKGKEVYIKQR